MPKKNGNHGLSGWAVQMLRKFISWLFLNKHGRIVLLLIMLLAIASVGISTSTVTSSRIVRLGLRDIGELTTQAGYFTNVQVIKDSKELFGWKIPFTSSKYIFSYDGTVKAGIDFSKIDVHVNPATKTIHVTLPEAQIFSLEVDPESLQIYDETKSIFTPLELTDVNDAVSALKIDVEQQAIANGLLDNADENARILVENMLGKVYDLREYKIVFH